MIDEKYIKTFIPVQELEELRPASENGIVPLSDNDLFLISKISSYSTQTSNAKAVSLKMSYGNLGHKLSSDLDI